MVRKSAPALATLGDPDPSTPALDDATAPSSPEARRPTSGQQAPLRAPSTVANRYRVTGYVGRGGSAEIFEVVDEARNRRLALKRLRPGAAREETTVRLFEREYHTLANLKHPRIVRVYDYGVDESQFYTMDLVEGRDLRELAPLPFKEACRHLRDIASSLALLHTRRLLYRDLSPRNVRVDANGSCRLLDFGALIPFGTAEHLVGTPPSVPPEAFHRLSLDQRSDLYGLGAVGYFLLSGRHAYPVRQFSQLPRAWERPPLPLRSFVPDIPAKLEELILAMLSLDPLERPAHAAEVIDALSASAGLEPETDDQVAHAYLLSPGLVGRKAELTTIGRRLEAAVEGSGSAVWLEGSLGVGKTRLVSELRVTAKLQGALAVCVDAESQHGSIGFSEGLALALCDEAPQRARAAAQPYLTGLAQLSETFRKRLDADPSEASSSAGERRAVLHAALSDWICATTRSKPLVVFVDNVQWADQAAAALLVTLAERAADSPLLLVVTHRSGEVGFAGDTLERLRSRSAEIALAPLRTPEIVALVESLFGKVPYTHRFAEWLERQVGGNPLYCLELARHAVDRGIARYEQGTWVLPEQRPDEAVPTSSEDAFLFTLAMLSPEARNLAEYLSGHRGPVPIGLCLALADDPSPERVYALLNELVERDVLISHGDTYRFRQGALRDRILKRQDAERRHTIHRKLGEAKLARGDADPRSQIEAGWHLLLGGEELRGAELLAGLVDKTRTVHRMETDLHAAVPAIEASLKVFQKRGRDALDQTPLLVALVTAGYYADRAMARRYGDEAVRQLRQVTGLELGARLQPLLGKRLSLGVGLAAARARFAFASRDPSRRAFEELFSNLLTTVTYLCGIASLCLDPQSALRYASVLEPLTILGNKAAPSGVYRYCQCLTEVVRDRFADAHRGIRTLIHQLGKPRGFRGLREESRRLLLGGAWYALGVLESFRDTGAVLDCAEQLDRSGLKFYTMIADRLRVSYHLYRGETDAVAEYRNRVESYACQTGSTWQVEVWGAAANITAHYRTSDALGVKQCAERLEALGAEIPSLKVHARLAGGLYDLLRGDATRAVENLSDIREYRTPRDHVGWAPAQGQTAHAYNAAGRHEEARRICRRALEHLSEADRDFVVMTLDIEIQLALAEAGLGEPERGAEQLDALIERYETDRGPVTRARLYQARAQVASLAGDRAAVSTYLGKMEVAARSTQNSSLVAQWKRVARCLLPPETLQAAPARQRLDRFHPWATTFAEIRFAVPRHPAEVEDEFTATESRMDS